MPLKTKRTILSEVLILSVGFFFGFLLLKNIHTGDYPAHIALTEKLSDMGYIFTLPHTLFAKLVIIIRTILPLGFLARINPYLSGNIDKYSYEFSAIVLLSLAYTITALIIFKRAKKELENKDIRNSFLIATAITATILVVGPVFVFTAPESIYLGYIAPNIYHNPTFILLRPLALLLFFTIADHFLTRANWKVLIFAAVLVFLATTAKPNFTLTILPAIYVVYIIFYVRKTKEINWWLLIFAVSLTGVIVLGAQYFMTYSENSTNSIVFSPFTTFLEYSPNHTVLIIKIFMSIIFPLSVTILYWKNVSRNLPFQLGWTNFIVGIMIALFFMEDQRSYHGNFVWGPMIGIFILFVVAVIFYIPNLMQKHNLDKSCWLDYLPLFILVGHVICGIRYIVIASMGNILLMT